MRRDSISQQLRKLRETLVRLVLFNQTNQEEYFYHYILIEEYDAKKKTINSIDHYFDIECKHLDSQLSEIVTTLSVIESKLNYGQVWHESKNKHGKGNKCLKSERALFDEALTLAPPIDKMALGYFYRTYGLESSKVHANFGVTATQLRAGENEDSSQFLGFVVMRVLLHVAELAHIDIHGKLSDIKKFSESEAFKKQSESRTVLQIKKGDIVEVFAHLGIVRNTKDSEFGYRAVLVDFGNNTIVEGEREDWYASIFVHHVMSVSDFDRLIWKRVKKLNLLRKVSFGVISRNSKKILEKIHYENNKRVTIIGGDESKKQIERLLSGDNQMDDILKEVFSSAN